MLFSRAASVAGAVLLLAASGAPASARPQAAPGVERGWIGLFTPEILGRLENQNRLAELCPQGPGSDGGKHEACTEEKLAPAIVVIPVRREPSRSDPAIGSIVVVADPGDGLDAFATTGQSGAASWFVPDERDRDWGYGPPYFHQTFIDRRGTWFRLPARPFDEPVWIDTSEWSAGHAIDVQLVDEHSIYESPRGDLFVLAVEAGGIVARAEQEADMPCSGDEPPLRPAPEWRIPWQELYDADGHLLLHVKYTRGC